jgi:PTS system fructose-specific IIA component/PTS system nitrogen regulatory IIA component
MKLADLIVKDAIVPQIKATEREGAIRELVEALVQTGAVPADQVASLTKALLDREKHGSTGFGKGVAVPHAKHPAVKKRVATIGRSTEGIDFCSLDEAPVYTVVLLLSPPETPELHLEAMEIIFRHLQQDSFRRFLRQAATRQETMDLIAEVDQTAAVRQSK